MVDFHTHVLPDMDDGSKNIDMTFSMLHKMKRQHINKIVATPHFYAHKDSVELFLRRREQCLQNVTTYAEEHQILLPKMRLGAEVYYFKGMGQASMVRELCIEGTNVLLLEMPFCQWKRSMVEEVKELIEGQGITIVLAHIERYYSFQKKKAMWEELLTLPLYKQMNAGAFLDWRTRKRTLKLLKGQEVVLLGSDCHNDTTRVPNMVEGVNFILEKQDVDYLEKLNLLEDKLLGQW